MQLQHKIQVGDAWRKEYGPEKVIRTQIMKVLVFSAKETYNLIC